jgi:CRISPR-associated protein Cst1
VGYLFSQGGFYQNLYNPGWFGDLKKFIDFFTSDKVFKPASSSTSVCGFCSESKFEVEPVDATQMSFLFPVFSQFPNAYWQNNEKAVTQICSLCKFLIIHHHLALTRLSDGSENFINAPSFQVMWYLNRFAREVFGSASSEEMRTKRNILAMSVIEYATKIQVTLGVWTGMNIEVVSRRGGEIEFFSLPYEVIQLLADRRIASLLSQIGEFQILNRVLDLDFSRLMEMGYRLLRIGLKPYKERSKSENDFVNQTLRLEKNRQDPTRVAEQIFKLCALIEEKRKRREEYDDICFARS